MALTGLGLFGFVVAHLIGNLQVFLGPEVFNEYAAFLKGLGPLLWIMRGGLLLIFALHVITAFSLTRLNTKARPERYRSNDTVQASLASRYMMQSGMVLLIFVVIHLLHFTLGFLQPDIFNQSMRGGQHDVYMMLVTGFQVVPYSVGYIIGMCFLGLHLSHAISSLFQTLGFTHPRYTPGIKMAGKALGALIALGYISIPLGVLTGIITLPHGTLPIGGL